ncbi:MAG TPA: signal peptide peptidase SppA [Candidatus Binataceae bacterium]|nr:signal peptide peptidase SppA [Candidatus Binataceae bacterium]
MFRRLLRWLVRSAILVAVVFLIVGVSRYIAHRYRPGSVLQLELDGPLSERADGSPFGRTRANGLGLNVVRRALRSAAEDPRIVGLAIKVFDPDMELAQAQELNGLIDGFRAHGKWISAYMETAGEGGFGNLPYLVASDADEVSMMPQGELNILGVSIRELFARNLLDNIKVKPVFDAIGKYKSAGNIFTEKDFTPAQREEDEALAGSLFGQIVNQTASHRRLDPAALRALIEFAPLTAADGVKSKLLDRLEYEDEFDDRIESYRGEHHEMINATDYVGPQRAALRMRNKIAVIYGLGAIARGESDYDPILSPGSSSMGSDDMIAAFKAAREDDAVRAVVFRIDSPGGSVIASELIRRAVELCATEKPVVVSMAGLAASGGFWVSTPAAQIFADPGTLTGSIGVLGGKFDVSGAAAALGIDTDAISHGANAEMFDSFTDFTPAQAKLFHDQLLGDTYSYFVKLVAQQRHLTVDQVDAVAQGRVWTGAQALDVKLIDHLGDFDAALAAAKTLANLDPHEPVRIVELPAQVSWFGRLLSGHIFGTASWRPPHGLEPLIESVREALARQGAYGQAYCPIRPVM